MMRNRGELTRRDLVRAGATGTLLSLAGCTTISDFLSDSDGPAPSSSLGDVPEAVWPQYGYDSGGSNYNPNVAFPSKPSVSWEVPIEDFFGAVPFFDGERLYFSFLDGGHSIIDVNSESVLERQIPMRVETVWDDFVYCHEQEDGETGRTIAVKTSDIDAAIDEMDSTDSPTRPYDGYIEWEYDRALYWSVRHDDSFYGVTSEDSLVALDAMSGEHQWSFEYSSTPSDVLRGPEHVLLPWDEHIIAVDAESGEEQWRISPDSEAILDSFDGSQVPDPPVEGPVDLELTIEHAVIRNGLLFADIQDPWHSIQATSKIDPATGDRLSVLPQVTGLGATDSILFDSTGLWEIETGDAHWEAGDDFPIGWSPHRPVIAARNNIIVGGEHPYDEGKGRIAALSQSDGSLSWKIDIQDRVWGCIAVEDTIYATLFSDGAEDGSIIAVS